MTRIRTVAGVGVAIAALAAPAGAQAKAVIAMSGSTSVAPLAPKLARAYIHTHFGVGYRFTPEQVNDAI